MKRFFAIIISICMLFCFMPTTAFADDIGGSLEETETQGIEVNEPEGEEQNIEGEEQNGENPIRIISDNAEENNPNEAHFNVSQPLDSDVNTVKLAFPKEFESISILKKPAGERLSNLDTYKFIDSKRGCPGNNSTSVSFDREKMEVIQNSELYKYMKENHKHNEVSNIPFSMPAASQGIAYNLPEDMKGEKCSETETYEEYFKGFYEENMTDLINACGDEYKTELRHSATVYSINVPTDKKTGVVIHIKKLEDKAAEDITASGNDKVQLKHEEVVNNAEAETAKILHSTHSTLRIQK